MPKGWYGDRYKHSMSARGITSNMEIRSFDSTVGSESLCYGTIGEYECKSEEIADESKPAYRNILMLNRDLDYSRIRFFIRLHGKEKTMLHYDIMFDDIRYFINEIYKTNPTSGELLLKYFNQQQKNVRDFIKDYRMD